MSKRGDCKKKHQMIIEIYNVRPRFIYFHLQTKEVEDIRNIKDFEMISLKKEVIFTTLQRFLLVTITKGMETVMIVFLFINILKGINSTLTP